MIQYLPFEKPIEALDKHVAELSAHAEGTEEARMLRERVAGLEAIDDLSTFFEREAGMVQLNIVDPSWLVFSGGFDYSTPRRLSKRFFDLLAAGALLLVSWPLMVLVGLAVWVESGGPVFYSQIPFWLESSVKGGVTPSGTVAPYTWTYSPNSGTANAPKISRSIGSKSFAATPRCEGAGSASPAISARICSTPARMPPA